MLFPIIWENGHVIYSKIYAWWVKTDAIIGFLAPENIEIDHICQNFRPWAKNNFSDFYWEEKMAIFRTAKSRSYETKRMPKTDSSGLKTEETVSIVERAFQNLFSVDQCYPITVHLLLLFGNLWCRYWESGCTFLFYSTLKDNISLLFPKQCWAMWGMKKDKS